jgi:hypothetical protein
MIGGDAEGIDRECGEKERGDAGEVERTREHARG